MEYISENEYGDGLDEEYLDGKICKCDSCGMMFSSLADLKKHVLGVHKPHKEYNCDICGESFNVNSKLNKHKKAVHQIAIEF